MSTQLPVINLMGPTASGKTALACQLYEQGGFEFSRFSFGLSRYGHWYSQAH